MRMTRAEFLRWAIAAGATACVGGSGESGSTSSALAQSKKAGSRKPDDDGLPAGPRTPLLQYPGISAEEIAAAFPGFKQTQPPNLKPGLPILETTFGELAATAKANPGRRIRVTRSDPGGLANLVNVVDVEILIPGDVEVGTIRAEDGSLRMRIAGEGPGSRVGLVRVGGAAHSTFHSLLLRGSTHGPSMEVASASGPTSFISCIAASNETWNNTGVHNKADDLLIAGCNLGAVDGRVGWCVRFQDTNRVVMVDSFCEGRSQQAVIRRGGNSGQYLFKRVTTINRFDNEAFSDVGSGIGGEVHGDCHLSDCTSYVGGTFGIRFGGYSVGNEVSKIWRVRNHTFYSVGKRITESDLEEIEERAPTAGDWQYRLGNPRFLAWDGKHPGWPERKGIHGKALAINDPYAL